MAYYWTCPVCGSNLDPGESCSDCKAEQRYEQPRKIAAAEIRSSNPMARQMLNRSYDRGMSVSINANYRKQIRY